METWAAAHACPCLAARLAGSVEGAAGGLFFPARLIEMAGLREGESDHGHQRVPAQALP